MTSTNETAQLPLHFVILGNTENRRVNFFQNALIFHDFEPHPISYESLLKKQTTDEDENKESTTSAASSSNNNSRLTYGQILKEFIIKSLKKKLKITSSTDSSAIYDKVVVLRLDSPGENFEVEKHLIAEGSQETAVLNSAIDDDNDDECNELAPKITAQQALQTLKFDMGLILFQRQWYLGYKSFLLRLHQELSTEGFVDLATIPAHRYSHPMLDNKIKIRWMNHPLDVLIMFDKCLTHKHLVKHDIPVPPAFFNIKSYDELRLLMDKHSMTKVFVKIAHGSSASGVVAYECKDHKYTETMLLNSDPEKKPAVWAPRIYDEYCKTSAELIRGNNDSFKLYNSLQIRKYTKHKDIRDVINYLCSEKVIVERWMPKARQGDRNFDIRVVVINGKAQHFVVRTSSPDVPMTNLHLGNKRGNSEMLLEQMKNSKNPQCWEQIQATCEKVANVCFPRSMYMGLDVLVSPDFKTHYILEVNAFGDLIPNIHVEGMDTYTYQVKELKEWYKKHFTTIEG